MARTKQGLAGISGLIGPIIIKQYADKTVVTARPNMRKVKRSKEQKTNSSAFAEAVAYARRIVRDPKKKQEFAKKLKKGASVYHAAISEWLLQKNP